MSKKTLSFTLAAAAVVLLVLAAIYWVKSKTDAANASAQSAAQDLPLQNAEDIGKAATIAAISAANQNGTLNPNGTPAGNEHNAYGNTSTNTNAGGKGAGVFDARSKFKPLVARPDVIPWAWLTDVPTRQEGTRLLPVFNKSTLLLTGKVQRVQGYMLPLEAGGRQGKFVLMTVPPSCPYCTPGGPESMVQVIAKEPVKMSDNPVVAEGNFETLERDEHGFYYRLTDAFEVK